MRIKERLASKIRRLVRSLSTQVQERLLFALGRMPAGERVCHGDFHPGNVLLTDKGEVVIEWIDATCGNPLADVARSSIITLGVAESEPVSNAFLKFFVRIFHRFYISRYFRQNPGDVQEYRSWFPIVAAARMSEQIPELEAWLLKQAQVIL